MKSKYLNFFLKNNINFKEIKANENISVLEGNLVLNHTFEGEPIYKSLIVKIIFYKSYPHKLPEIYSISPKIKISYHINPNRSLCLGTELEIRKKLVYQDYSLESWINEFVYSYFYSYFYYIKYKRSPYGERSHGDIGDIEAAIDFFNFKNFDLFYKFLKKFTSIRKYRRILKYKNNNLKKYCPCNSGKKINDCHIKEILLLKKIYKKKTLEYMDELIKKYEQYWKESKYK